MTNTIKQIAQRKPPIFFARIPETNKLDEVFPESELPESLLVIPMFWSDASGYMTVPGTEFEAKDFAAQIEAW